MLRKEDEPLWDLLGRAKQPEVSPFFARNVLRAVRDTAEPATVFHRWFSLRRLVPISAAAVVLIAASLFLRPAAPPAQQEESPSQQFDPVAQIDPQDYDVVADLDNLMASEATNPWDDDTSTL